MPKKIKQKDLKAIDRLIDAIYEIEKYKQTCVYFTEKENNNQNVFIPVFDIVNRISKNKVRQDLKIPNNVLKDEHTSKILNLFFQLYHIGNMIIDLTKLKKSIKQEETEIIDLLERNIKKCDYIFWIIKHYLLYLFCSIKSDKRDKYKHEMDDLNQKYRKAVIESYFLSKQLENFLFKEEEHEINDVPNFIDLYDHLSYLDKNNRYKIQKNADGTISVVSHRISECKYRIIFLDRKNQEYYHGTSFERAKQIILEGFMPSNNNIDTFDFNKVFFTTNMEIAKFYGAIGGAHTDILPKNEYIIFKVNLKQYDVYSLKNIPESFVWGKVGANTITNIYLCHGDEVREVNKEELMNLNE